MKKHALIVISALLALTQPSPAAESYTNAYEAMTVFTKVLEEVHRSYVDGNEAGYDALIRHALSGMLQDLDPYSQFLDCSAYQDLKENTSGHFGGIGIVINKKDRALTIVSPMEDTPGFRAGLLSGDVILEIDGHETRVMSLSETIDLMRGEPGTKVDLRVLRPKTADVKTYTIIREDISVASIKGTEMLEGNIGYIRITQFNEPTAANLKEQLKTLADQGMKAFILDLRGNPGGLLTAAAGVAELFLPKDDLIVFTRGRDGTENGLRYKSSGKTHYTSFPMAILVNGGSASASEIVAGALQDHKRAILIGEKTFGKGSVQSILPLADESAVKLTTAKYYTPSERVIHEKGIEPDILSIMAPETLFKIRTQPPEPADSPEAIPDNRPELHDLQLEKALGVLQGILIYKEQE